MHFRRLRLVGFKSFVEPIELTIEPGLTGIVGPNGCGKSNLVEALRWVMGETSAKKMRGSGMDDVIFAGTNSRPSRNLAEVTVTLDNRARRAPAAYNESDDVEITRRIERELGSDFRVNGRDVRARDVTRLFADVATGAHSTALVSQGEIGALIKAKPEDRRSLIEEAAGITGLYSRRHEAELRLRAAETNLTRVADVLTAFDTQLRGLKQQARQASRYRNLSGHIRRTEATLLYLTWRKTSEDLAKAKTLLAACESEVADATQAAAHAATMLNGAAEQLPDLRQAEAQTAAAVHRLKLAGEQLDRDERRALDERQALEARIAQIESDSTRELSRVLDAEAAIARLASEAAALSDAEANAADALAEALSVADASRATASADEARVEKLAADLAAAEARAQSLTELRRDCYERAARIADRLRTLRDERDRLHTASADFDLGLGTGIDSLRHAAETARRDLATAELTRAGAAAQAARLAALLKTIEAPLARLGAEEAALAAILKDGEPELWPPLIDAVTVTPGYEAALAAALGDDLTVAANESAPIHWRSIDASADDAAPLPDGAVRLDHYVTAPSILVRRLSQVGVVDDADGSRLQANLAQGQRLVSLSGGLWRWDGFTVTAGATTAALARLQQRQRLNDVRAEIKTLRPTVEAATASAETAATATEAARLGDAEARERLWAADEELRAAIERNSVARREAEARIAKLAAIGDGVVALGIEQRAANEALRRATAELNALTNRQALRRSLEKARGELGERRKALASAAATLEGLRRTSAARIGRLRAAETERDTWSVRAHEANAQIVELARRRSDAEAQLAAALARPVEIAAERQALLSQTAEAERVRRDAADRLAEAETACKTSNEASKTADRALAAVREERVRRAGFLTQATERLSETTHRIRQTLDCDPPEARVIGEIKDDADVPEADAVEARLQRLVRERETMGPVNLRAEQEAEEVNAKLVELQSERTDLEGAIAKLRHGIVSLNREGRERLLEAFKKVDENFRNLFGQLFAGDGRAFLTLTEAEDPLDAGLEIMASPPGKRMQALSLLSGGEQALTATALLLAVFQANPAPLCVMDEVDAPLDDANVERFCGLIGAISRQTGTRFLLITHNPVTMARMDRLYGVTMAERGVSQLVSVDLSRAEALRATA
ncbi:MAG: chromosome segregation protein SMC [Alphaproteobacteria bacterium]|nr:chromosome segregation protein SMC [Alphaproteobacteria bacterium]